MVNYRKETRIAKRDGEMWRPNLNLVQPPCSFRDDGEDGATEEMDEETRDDIKQMQKTPNLYSRLVSNSFSRNVEHLFLKIC